MEALHIHTYELTAGQPQATVSGISFERGTRITRVVPKQIAEHVMKAMQGGAKIVMLSEENSVVAFGEGWSVDWDYFGGALICDNHLDYDPEYGSSGAFREVDLAVEHQEEDHE